MYNMYILVMYSSSYIYLFRFVFKGLFFIKTFIFKSSLIFKVPFKISFQDELYEELPSKKL